MANLEGMVLSNSKAKTWRRCPKAFDYKYNQKLEKIRRKTNLEMGSWIHSLLEDHCKGKNWKKTHKKLIKRWRAMTFEDEEASKTLPQDVERLMMAYLIRYRKEDKHLKTVATELNETITLPNGLRFNFIIDRVVEDHGGLWLWDYRAVRSFMDEDFMMLDAVMARYFYGAIQLGMRNLRGVMFDEIRTKAPTIPRLLRAGGLSKAMNIDTDPLTYYREIERHGLNPDDYARILKHLKNQRYKFFKRTHLPKSKVLMVNTMTDLIDTAGEIKDAAKKGRYPRSNDRACKWCDFLTVCQVQYNGGDATALIRQNYKRRIRR